MIDANICFVGPFPVQTKRANFLAELSAHLDNSRTCQYFTCLNPHSYAMSLDDDTFYAALQASRWVIPDGIGIKLLSGWGRNRIKNRVTGFDVFEFLMQESVARSKSVFLLGGSEDNLRRMSNKLREQYSDIQVVGSYSPEFCDDFSEEENSRMVKKVNESGADIVLISLSAPKQEKWIFRNQEKLNPVLCCPIGAVFDFYTGRVRRSPRVFRALGLEWLPRLLQEPARLWRRSLISPLVCVRDVFFTHKGRSL